MLQNLKSVYKERVNIGYAFMIPSNCFMKDMQFRHGQKKFIKEKKENVTCLSSQHILLHWISLIKSSSHQMQDKAQKYLQGNVMVQEHLLHMEEESTQINHCKII